MNNENHFDVKSFQPVSRTIALKPQSRIHTHQFRWNQFNSIIVFQHSLCPPTDSFPRPPLWPCRRRHLTDHNFSCFHFSSLLDNLSRNRHATSKRGIHPRPILSGHEKSLLIMCVYVCWWVSWKTTRNFSSSRSGTLIFIFPHTYLKFLPFLEVDPYQTQSSYLSAYLESPQ